jgi:hypothetical protein
MKHLSQQMLSEELRRPHLRRRRVQLQGMLQTVQLSAEARGRLLNEMMRIGKPKIYGAETSSPFVRCTLDMRVLNSIQGGDR